MFLDTAARAPVDDVIARARARVTATGARADAESILAARDADRRWAPGPSATPRPSLPCRSTQARTDGGSPRGWLVPACPPRAWSCSSPATSSGGTRSPG